MTGSTRPGARSTVPARAASTSPPRKPLGRYEKWLRAVAALFLAVLFLVALAGATLLHSNLPASRRVAARLLTASLESTFVGRISIGKVTSLSAYELEVTDVVLRDGVQRVVLTLSNVRARVDVLGALRQLVLGRKRLSLVINHVRVDRAEAALETGPSGQPTLVEALMLRPSATPTAESGEGFVRVWLPQIEIGRAFARGSLNGSPTLEAEATSAHGSVLVTPKRAAIDVERFPLSARGLGGTDAKGIATLHVRTPGAMWSSFDGYIGDVQFGSVARWEKEELDLTLDVPRAEPASVRALLREWPLLRELSAHLSLKGKPSNLVTLAEFKVGASTLDGRGTLALSPALRLDLDVDGRELDLRAVWAEAPPTAFTLRTALGIHEDDGKAVITLGGVTAPTSLRDLALPSLEFSGTRESLGTFSGLVTIHEPFAPVSVKFTLAPNGRLVLDASANSLDLAKIDRLRPYFEGSGKADLRAHGTLENGTLDSTWNIDVRSIAYQGATLESAKLVARVKGVLAAPEKLAITLRANGKNLVAGRYQFEGVSAESRGPITQPTVSVRLDSTSGPSVGMSAILALGSQVSARDAKLRVSRNDSSLEGSVARVEVGEGRVKLDGVAVHGASGDLEGSGEFTRNRAALRASANDFDLSSLARILGLPRGSLEGRAALAIDMQAGSAGERGTLALKLRDGSLANVSGLSGEVRARLDGRHLTGQLEGELAAVAGVSATWDGVLGGPALDVRSFERATGTAKIDVSHFALDYLGQLFPEYDLQIDGQGTIGLTLERPLAERMPDVKLEARTSGLGVRYQPQGATPVVLQGVDLEFGLGHTAETNRLGLVAAARRGQEELATASADLEFDSEAALRGQKPWMNQLEEHELLAKFVLRESRLEALPTALRVPGLRGSARLEATVRGSLASPVVTASLRGSDIRIGEAERADPLDICAMADYERATGTVALNGEAFLPAALALRSTPCAGRRVALVRANAKAPWLGPERHDRKLDPDYTASLQLLLDRLPLASVPQLARARVTGTVSGTFNLDKTNGPPNTRAVLQIDQARLDKLAIGSGGLDLRSDAGVALFGFDLAQETSRLSGKLTLPLTWASEVPALDAAEPIEASVEASSIDASLLAPWLGDYLADLHGATNANLKVRLDPAPSGKDDERRPSAVSGFLSLTHGAFQVAGLGLRLSEVSFRAEARADGTTTIVDIPKLEANALSRSPNLLASASLRLAGLDLVSGNARVNVNQLPLVMDGVTRAQARAEALLTLRRLPEMMVTDVTFDILEVQLSDDSSKELTELDEHPGITILQPLSKPKAPRAEDSLLWQFAIHLQPESRRSSARLTRGVLLNLPISGDPVVGLGEQVGVSGRVELVAGGTVQMVGKIFVIDGGSVYFDTGDATDPRLDIAASWRAPDGDVLNAYVRGTLSRPILDFDRDKSVAWAMLLGGDEKTVGVSALEGLLADTPLAKVQLRASSDDTAGTAKYTAAYRASDRVVLEGSYSQGDSSSTSSTDSTQNGATVGYVSAAVEWRFKPNWSLRTEVGTAGTNVDLLWQVRY